MNLLISRSLAICTATLAVLAVSQTSSAQINADKSLWIKDVSVVDDARAVGNGPWSFGTLMTRMAGNVPPAQFVENWLDTWLTDQTVAGTSLTVTAKPAFFQNFKNNWLNASGGNQLDLSIAPFRLLGIVNRPDLVNFAAGQAAELRFTFAATRMDGTPLNAPRRFFVIFEYGVPGNSCDEIKTWQNNFFRLGQLPFGNQFNSGLQFITDLITNPVPAAGRPNGSLLNQLRSNELSPGVIVGTNTFFWELREWNVLTSAGINDGELKNVTTKLTPRFDLLSNQAGRDTLGAYLTQNSAAILNESHTVPDFFQGAPFQAVQAINAERHPTPPNGGPFGPTNRGTKWWATGFEGFSTMTMQEALIRHRFAKNTCSGCHFHETGTISAPNDFVMASERAVGQETSLSGFLTGITVNDPVAPAGLGLTHTFNDLDNRKQIMIRILRLDCSLPLTSNSTLKDIRASMGSRVH